MTMTDRSLLPGADSTLHDFVISPKFRAFFQFDYQVPCWMRPMTRDEFVKFLEETTRDESLRLAGEREQEQQAVVRAELDKRTTVVRRRTNESLTDYVLRFMTRYPANEKVK